jgi:HK97 family phage portal protein
VLLGHQNSHSGVSVNINSALKVSTVFACLRVLANGIAQVPLKLYREDAKTEATSPAIDHPVYKLIYRRPNAWMTSFEFRQMTTFHAGLLGVAVSYVGRVRGKPAELIPLVPGTFTLSEAADHTPICRLSDGTELGPENLFILRGPTWHCAGDMSAITIAREAIGLAIATEETHGALHANGTMPGGVLSVKGTLDQANRDRLRASWAQYQGGLRNKFKTAVLDQDATWTPMAATGVDNQHIETRRFQIEEICRHFGVFPQMIGHTDKTATFASAEAFFLAHVVHSLNPWVENWEQSLARDLFPKEDDLFAKFSLQGLLRGDNKTRAEFYTAGIVNGWMTRNEARRLEDLNPLDGLDEPLLPLNMGTQRERDAMAQNIVDTMKAAGFTGNEREIFHKIGRVLSASNERRIVGARDNLTEVLASLGDS